MSMSSRTRRRLAWGVGILVVLTVLWLLYQGLLRRLDTALHEALGPRATIGRVEWGWNGLTVHDLRLGAAPGWPAGEELSAQRIFIQPDLRSLFSGPWRLHRIDVEDASISLLRDAKGKLQVLPGLLKAHGGGSAKDKEAERHSRVKDTNRSSSAEGGASDVPEDDSGRIAIAASAASGALNFSVDSGPGTSASSDDGARDKGRGRSGAEPDVLIIDHVQLHQVRVDFYDGSLRPQAKPHHMAIDELDADIDNLHIPSLDQAVAIALQGRLKGVEGGGERHDGRIEIKGKVTPFTHDADLSAKIRGADLRVVEPYLLKAAESGIRQGLLDLTLEAKVKDDRLKAPGTIVITGLELRSGGGWWNSLGTAGRQAVLNTLSQAGKIEVHFTLEGRLDDPNFSLNESLAKRFATGLADAVGVSLGGVVEGLGSMIKGLFGR
jgi:hypothetical protein